MRPDTLGPYTLGEPLGKGGMGAVYRATHAESGLTVAIKVLNPRLAVSEGFRDRFEGEIESLKALRHTGIVRLFGHGEEDGVLFYAMELVEGPSLEEELRAGRRFTWRETTQIAIQVCRALKHAHDHGVVHRDIKPANLLLAPNGDPKLADFGIARMFGSTGVTIAGGVLGTADYMSPEQAAGTPVSARCDQYSLGGVMYALLTGRPPFRATDMAAMLQLQRFAIPEPVRRFAPDTPLELERIIAKMLEKDPTARFPNTRVIARRLEAMSQGLARVAADDFEVYHTDEADTDDATEDAVALAVTREAGDDDAPPSSPKSFASDPLPPLVSEGPSYTHVEAEAPAVDSAGWSSAIGQVAVLAIALGSLAGAVWWFTRPVSADSLYRRVQRSVEGSDKSVAAVDAARVFADRFPDDPRAEEVAEWGSTLRLEQLRRRMKLTRRIGDLDQISPPEETLLRRASQLAESDAEAGAVAFDRLADLLRAGEDASPQGDSLADLAHNEARRLREAAAEERRRLAAFCTDKLRQARGAEAASVARAVLNVLPDSPETREVLESARKILGRGGAASTRPPVAPGDALR